VEQGPVVTRYELLPAANVKIERIGNLANNITLALKAESIRVQAPIPGKGVVGIEVPNRSAAPVVLRQLLESAAWTTSKAALPLALGRRGHVLMADRPLAAHAHRRATGPGMTVCMNSILAGLLMTRTPEELRPDPDRYEDRRFSATTTCRTSKPRDHGSPRRWSTPADRDP
jgi:S-DNA-T family DNA segregation ATPase FtsK/SpoIIIE